MRNELRQFITPTHDCELTFTLRSHSCTASSARPGGTHRCGAGESSPLSRFFPFLFRGLPMSPDRFQRRIRMHALAAATAVAISTLAAPAFAGKVELDGLQSAKTHDQFIVRYREGSAERKDVGKAKGALHRAAAAGVGGKGLALGHQRRLAIGADVVRADRKLDRVEAESLMRQIAA